MGETTSTNKKTPLYNLHVQAKAKMVPFGGWVMPVSYEGVLAEHRAVRQGCGIFDVSHMGEIRVKGSDAERFLQWLTINDVSRLKVGSSQYSAILNERGGMIDDLIIYRLGEDDFFICVNASNRERDYAWIHDKSKGFKVEVHNESDLWAQVAVQGPNSLSVVAELLAPEDALRLKSLAYTHIMPAKLFAGSALIARTGYTGEKGFEIYLSIKDVERVWCALLEMANKYGVQPIGLGARDTLRLEACYLLYGNDMTEDVTPLEAGIGWATKLDKGDFIGRNALIAQKAAGLKRQLSAFIMLEEGIPRHGMPVVSNGHRAGEVTSGSVLPSVGGAGGMALVETRLKEGDEILVDIRGNLKRARLVKRPLYSVRTKDA